MASPLAITVVLTVILSKVSSSAAMHYTSKKPLFSCIENSGSDHFIGTILHKNPIVMQARENHQS